MCRIIAVNAHNCCEAGFDPKTIFHILMLSGQAEGQNDGCGITDGTVSWKSGGRYMSTVVCAKIHDLRNNIWLGHVRQASPGTTHGPNAAHPYTFKSENERLVGVHNGVFKLRRPRTLNTDSEEFYQLLFQNRYVLEDPELLEYLINHNDLISFSESKYAIAYFYNKPDRLFVLRNSERDLYVLRDLAGRWYAIHTSETALANLSEFYGIDGTLQPIQESVLYTFYPDHEVTTPIRLPKYVPTHFSTYRIHITSKDDKNYWDTRWYTDHTAHGNVAHGNVACDSESNFYDVKFKESEADEESAINIEELPDQGDEIMKRHNAWCTATDYLRHFGYFDEGVIQAIVAKETGIKSNWWEMTEAEIQRLLRHGFIPPRELYGALNRHILDVPYIYRADVAYYILKANKVPTIDMVQYVSRSIRRTKTLQNFEFITNAGMNYGRRLLMNFRLMKPTYSEEVSRLEAQFFKYISI